MIGSFQRPVTEPLITPDASLSFFALCMTACTADTYVGVATAPPLTEYTA